MSQNVIFNDILRLWPNCDCLR